MLVGPWTMSPPALSSAPLVPMPCTLPEKEQPHPFAARVEVVAPHTGQRTHIHGPITSAACLVQLETCATAVRVVLADRGYSVRALAASIAASPAMPLAALEAQQRHIQVRARACAQAGVRARKPLAWPSSAGPTWKCASARADVHMCVYWCAFVYVHVRVCALVHVPTSPCAHAPSFPPTLPEWCSCCHPALCTPLYSTRSVNPVL